MLSGHRSGLGTGGAPCGVMISRTLLGNSCLGPHTKLSDEEATPSPQYKGRAFKSGRHPYSSLLIVETETRDA